LDLTVNQAAELLSAMPAIHQRLRMLREVSLSYLTLGQSALTLSGGEAQRLKLARELARRSNGRSLYLLDEPTTGFDPSARRRAWEVVASLRDLGKTVFLTTHYMDEAQVLADRVAIIARGQIVAEGAPDALGGREDAAARISFRLPSGLTGADLPSVVAAALTDAAPRADGEVRLEADDPVQVLNALTSWALERRLPLPGLEVRRPTLEDVYLELTAGEPGDEVDE